MFKGPAIDWRETTRSQIKTLRAQLNSLLSDFIPDSYSDGDIRIIPLGVYRKARVIYEQIEDRQAVLDHRPAEFGPKRILFQGPLGSVEVRPAKPLNQTADLGDR